MARRAQGRRPQAARPAGRRVPGVADPRPARRHRAGYEPSGGTYTTDLSTLSRNGLVDVTGERVRAADVLFLASPPGERQARFS